MSFLIKEQSHEKLRCFDKTLSSLAPWKCGNDPFETMKEESELKPPGNTGPMQALDHTVLLT